MIGFEWLWGRLTQMDDSDIAYCTTNHDQVMRGIHFILYSQPRRGGSSAPKSLMIPHMLQQQQELSPFTTSHTPSTDIHCQLQLPQYMQDSASTPTAMFDSCGQKTFGTKRHPGSHSQRVELHLLYCKLPGFCKACSCSDQMTCSCLNVTLHDEAAQ